MSDPLDDFAIPRPDQPTGPPLAKIREQIEIAHRNARMLRAALALAPQRKGGGVTLTPEWARKTRDAIDNLTAALQAVERLLQVPPTP